MTTQEIAKEMRLTVEQVQQIELRALRKLRAAILKDPVLLELLGKESTVK